MRDEIMYKTISDELAKIKVLIDADNSLNLNDRNIFLEDVVGNILGFLLNISLKNVNFSMSNYPSIDLKDDLSRVAVQVTTNVTANKIQKTLDSFFENKYDEHYDSLYIVVFDNHRYIKSFNVKEGFDFNENRHIITYNKLLNLIKYSSSEKIEMIYTYVVNVLRNNVYNVDWIIKNSVKSLNNLGKRYNKKLNVYNYEERKIKMFFCNKECKNEILKQLNDFIIFVENNDFRVLVNLRKIASEFNLELLNDVMLYFKDIRNEVIKKYEKREKDYSKIYQFEKKYNELYTELKKLIDYYFSKVMIYKGVAGIGKSHTLAYVISQYYINDMKPALLVLGQDFYNAENIEKQFLTITNGNTDFEEMLDYINKLGIMRDINIPIVIDGLNESCENFIWKKGLNNFIEQISKYSNLKLILSIRDTYYDFCIPEEISEVKNILFCEHLGFSTNNMDAIKEFFAFYNVKMPIFQVLNDEFSNPLFLTLFCEIVSKYCIDINDYDYKNFVEIYDSYIQKMNDILLNKFELWTKSNIIVQIIDLYVTTWISERKHLSYDDFLQLLMPLGKKYEIKSTDLLNFIIDNGLFYRDVYLGEEIIRFSYERYEKISVASFLLKSIFDVESLRYELNDGFLKKYIDISDVFDNGILEEIINIIQMKYKVDFLSLVEVDKLKVDYYLKRDYIKSLVWLKNAYDSKIILDNINNIIKQDSDYLNEIVDIFIKMSYIKSNSLNIEIVDKYLSELSLPLLDYYWSIVIDDYYSNYSSKSIDNIIDFCLNYGCENLNEDSVYLLGILLCWLLSSSNRFIRDRVTKALTKLLINKHQISIRLLEHFKEVKDLYILERMIAAIYGSVVRSDNSEDISKLSYTLYDVIYKNTRTIDNIIIKLYSYKYFRYVKGKYSINLYDDIELETKSKWYESLPSNEEIDQYKFDLEECQKDKRKFANSTIIDSMVTEYGRGVCGYGDFGRYTLQRYLEPFAYLFEDIQLLANVATKRVFEYGYDYKLFGEYDSAVKYFQDRHEHSVERIGKKYQWIAMYELLSKLYDNFIPHYDVYSDDIIDLDGREYFDVNHKKTKQERNIKYVSYDLEEEHNYLLNIDTTNHILQQNNETEYLDNVYFDASAEEDYEKYLIKEIDNLKYINLFGLYSFEDRKYNLKNVDRNSLTIVCTAVIYSDKDKLESSEYKNYSCGTYNELFNIQLFDCSNSLEYCLDYDKRYQLQNFNTSYKTCYEQYIWEGIYDESIRGCIKILSPQKWIVDNFGLIRKSENEWLIGDKVVCIQPDIKSGKQELLFSYNEFVDFLKKNKLNICWTIFCEKTHNNSHYLWRVNMFYDYKKLAFTKEIYVNEEWESKPLF